MTSTRFAGHLVIIQSKPCHQVTFLLLVVSKYVIQHGLISCSLCVTGFL